MVERKKEESCEKFIEDLLKALGGKKYYVKLSLQELKYVLLFWLILIL